MLIHTLIVEDDPMVSTISEEYIQKIESFHLVDKVSHGQEALQTIRTQKVDLLLLDIYMPILNGLELLKEIRQEARNLDVILVTAANSPEIIEEALRLGVVDYILKPFNFSRFQSALQLYKKRYNMFKNDTILSQESIDSLHLSLNVAEEELPKGIDPVTLGIVRETLQNASSALTIHELSEQIKLSTLTIRKYLEHLAQNGEISLDLHFKAKGRPIKLYGYNH